MSTLYSLSRILSFFVHWIKIGWQIVPIQCWSLFHGFCYFWQLLRKCLFFICNDLHQGKKIVISLQEPSSYADLFCFHYCLSFIWKKLSATWHVTLIQSKLTLKNDLISYSTEATLIICPPKQPQLVVPPWRKFPPPFRDTPCSFMCCLCRPFKGAFT